MKPAFLIFFLAISLVGCASKPCKKCKKGGGGGGEPRLARGEGRGVLDEADEEERDPLGRQLDALRQRQDELNNLGLGNNNIFDPALGAGPQIGGFGDLQALPVPQGGPFGNLGNNGGQQPGQVGDGNVVTPPAAGNNPTPPGQPSAPLPGGQFNAIVNRRELSPSRGFRAAFETTHGDDIGELPASRRTLEE